MRKLKGSFMHAIKWPFLTKYYDFIIKSVVPEKKIKQFIGKKIESYSPQKILDFGTGTGQLALSISRNIEFNGVDPDPLMIKLANEKGISNASFIEYDGVRLPFKDKSFDLVVSTWVFHHLSDSQKYIAIQEIDRVLTNKGLFLLGDWGKPNNLLMRVAFFCLRIVDNFETYQSIMNGNFNAQLKDIGFEEKKLKVFSTLLGSFWVYEYKKNK